jgi:hypothetical protein
MRILLSDAQAKARAAEVIQYALAHRENLATLVARMNKEECPGDDPGHVLEIQDGYRVVVSVEQQPDPVGWCFHVSVSVWPTTGDKIYPHPIAVHEIIKMLGITGQPPQCAGEWHHDGVVELLFQAEPKWLAEPVLPRDETHS